MRIQNNIPGKRGLRYGRQVHNETSKTLEKLSSGYKINRASDDAAGLAVSEWNAPTDSAADAILM